MVMVYGIGVREVLSQEGVHFFLWEKIGTKNAKTIDLHQDNFLQLLNP